MANKGGQQNDKAEPGGEVMLRIANALGVKVEDIFFASGVVHTQQSKQAI